MVFLALSSMGVALSGCAAAAVIPIEVALTAGVAAAQEGVQVYSRGKVKAARFHSIESMHAATLRAFGDLEFPVRTSKLSPTRSYIEAEDATGTRTTVRITERSGRVSTMTIRVGVVGDRFIALLVLERMDRFLGELDAERASDEAQATGGS